MDTDGRIGPDIARKVLTNEERGFVPNRGHRHTHDGRMREQSRVLPGNTPNTLREEYCVTDSFLVRLSKLKYV